MHHRFECFICLTMLFSRETKLLTNDQVKAALPSSLEHFEITRLILVSDIHEHNERQTRHADKTAHLTFTVFGKQFDLIIHLHQENLQYPTFVTLISKNYTFEKRRKNYANGRLLDVNSRAHGIYREGIFNGAIYTNDEIYYMKPLNSLVADGENNSAPNYGNFVVVYRESDFKSTKIKRYGVGMCGVSNVNNTKLSSSYNSQKYPNMIHKRSSKTKTKRTRLLCNVHIVIDHLYFKIMAKSSVNVAIGQVLDYFEDVNEIFQGTDFNQDELPDLIGLYIQKVTIFDEGNTHGFNRKSSFSDGYQLLEDFSRESGKGFNWQTEPSRHFCLVGLLTSRTFKKAVVGLAYTGDLLRPSLGGICGGTLNTFMMSSQLHGNTLTQFQNALTIAHEIGHAFGSMHDGEAYFENLQCMPGDQYGKYLMFPSISSGNRPNNKIFSKCSLYYMNPFIQTKKDEGNCFKESVKSSCGNAIVEEGEECDCGPKEQCHQVDKCCGPPFSRFPCKFDRVTSHCSPATSPCCSRKCKILPRNPRRLCRASTECTKEVYCNGKTATCPNPKVLPNRTCQQNTRICSNGLCLYSICRLIGIAVVECQCKTSKDACKVCCKDFTKINSSCKPFDPADVEGVSITGPVVYKLPGTTCGQDKGYCNEEHTCIDGLNDLLWAQRDESIYSYISNFWYYILLASLMLGVALIFFVTFCSRKKNLPAKLYYTLLVESMDHLEIIEKLLLALTGVYQQAVQRIDEEQIKITIDYAERLTAFFPKTDLKTISRAVVLNSVKENGELSVVASLIATGQPFQNFVFEGSPYVNEKVQPKVPEKIRWLDGKCHSDIFEPDKIHFIE